MKRPQSRRPSSSKNPRIGDPLKLFNSWFEEAVKSGMRDPNAMNLATVSPSGRPSSRIVLLKKASEDGFVFFTNGKSRKGSEILANPFAALCFYWPELGKQVRVEGKIKEIPEKQSDEYYASRPLESRLGAWASLQSEKLSSREELIKRFTGFEAKFGFRPPRPPHWKGYALIPSAIEFWQEGEFRLHTRTLFKRKAGKWEKTLLYP